MRRSTLVWLGAGLVGALCTAASSACSNHGSGGSSTGSTTSGTLTSTGTAGGQAGESVLTHHGNPSRDGVYVQPAFTKTAAAGLKKDDGFNAKTDGATYAQPLFLDGGPGGKDVLFV